MADSIRVVHIVLSMDVGGMERGLVNQIREGQKLGEAIDVVCLERPGVLAPQLQALGVSVHCVHKKPGVRLRVIPALAKLLCRLQPDVVHTHQVGPLFYGSTAARRARVPAVIHTDHGKHYGRLRNRWLSRIAGRFADLFFCLTTDMANEVAARGIVPQSKIRVIANGIDLSRFQQARDKNRLRESLGLPIGIPLIGTIGRLVEVKRQDVLLRGFANLRDRAPEAHLVFVGDGPLLPELSALAETLHVRPYTHFVGYQAHPEDYLQALDVFALTSRSEGMPQTIMEASAAGIPVIASRVGGLPEIIEHEQSGLLFPAGDEAALAAGIWQLLSEKERAREMSEVGKRRVAERFDVRRMAADYHEYFRQLLERRQALIGTA
jgi:glycosyltransferase involved in cell wall biosynthesis